MGCVVSDGKVANQESGTEGNESFKAEQERIMAEIDMMKPPDSSVGNVCREPMIGRAVVETVMAGASGSVEDLPEESSKSRAAHASARLTESTKSVISEWRKALDNAEVDPLSDLKCEWSHSGVQPTTHGGNSEAFLGDTAQAGLARAIIIANRSPYHSNTTAAPTMFSGVTPSASRGTAGPPGAAPLGVIPEHASPPSMRGSVSAVEEIRFFPVQESSSTSVPQ
jgi:hypothetical protein